MSDARDLSRGVAFVRPVPYDGEKNRFHFLDGCDCTLSVEDLQATSFASCLTCCLDRGKPLSAIYVIYLTMADYCVDQVYPEDQMMCHM